jgi:hypothetical protein
MLTAADRDRMRADLAEVRDDRPVSVAVRRGNSTLAAQTVRVARSGTGRSATVDTGALQGVMTQITVLGGVGLDMRPLDRFTVDGMLYEVVAVHPNRDVAVMVEARLVQ